MKTKQRTAATFQIAPGNPATVVQPQVDPKAPFGIEYQAMLLRLLFTDGFFARPLVEHIEPQFFQNPVMQWMWSRALYYREQFGHLPTMVWLSNATNELDVGYRPIYAQVVAQVAQQPILDEAWLRGTTLDWVRRNIFRQAFGDARDLYAAGKYDEAYDLMQERLDKLRTASFDDVDRGWLAEEFVTRQATNAANMMTPGYLVGTGIPALDQLLEGGTYPGFLGTWIAYPKAGKTTLLANLGVVAMRAHFRRVLHFVLEGKRQMVEARYDSIISNELYQKVKRGDIDASLYAQAVKEMQYLRGLGILRGFTKDWATSALHFADELDDLKQQFGWEPDVVIVDYADLLRAREGRDLTETQHQIAGYKDLKRLMERGKGYRGWTASQVARPKDDDYAENPHLILSKNIADAYAKVRICDYIGSINQTNAERLQGIMRLYAEMFRDGPANLVMPISADFQKMTFGNSVVAFQTANPMGAMQGTKPFGYVGKNGTHLVQKTNGV